MRSDFVATLSRYHNGSIESEHYDDHLSVLTDIFKHWDGAASLIGEEILDVMSVDQADQVLTPLLGGLEGDDILRSLQEAGYDMAAKAMKDLVRCILDEMDEDTYAPMLQKMGWYKREVPE